MASRQNKKRSEGPALAEGGMVYLLPKNIKTMRPSKKLDHTKLGPFKVKKVLGPVTFELDLLKTMRIHPVFHKSLLEPCHNPNAMPGPIEIDEETQEPEWEVEEIVQFDPKKGYLVKWLGWGHSDNTWEPEENLTHAQEILDSFRRRHTMRGSRNRRGS